MSTVSPSARTPHTPHRDFGSYRVDSGERTTAPPSGSDHPLDPLTATVELVASLNCAGSLEALGQQVAPWLRELTNALDATCWQVEERATIVLSTARHEGGEDRLRPVETRLPALAAQAARGRLPVVELSTDRSCGLVAVPVVDEDRVPLVLTLTVLLGSAPCETFVIVAQLAAQCVAQWFVTQRAARWNWEAAAAAALVELLAGLASQPDTVTASQRLARELLRFTDAGSVFIGLRRRAGGKCRLVAHSLASPVDPRSELTAVVEPALEAGVELPALGVYEGPEALEAGVPGSARVARFLDVSDLSILPLRTLDGEAIGACILAGTRRLITDADARRALHGFGPPVATLLQGFVSRARAVPRWIAPIRSRRRRLLPLLCLAAALWLPFVPVPFRLRCDAQLHPEVRRFIAAPLTAILKETLVEPGDVVRAGQLLARLDRRELDKEVGALETERAESVRRRDLHRAQKNIGATQLAELEIRRCEARLSLLRDQVRKTEIRSPIEGILLAGDLRRTLNAPLTVGQTMFEVAPLERMTVELAIPPEELAQVRVGQPVEMRLESYPDIALLGKIERIRPRAELFDQRRVFIAEAVLANPGEILRPGMTGTAHLRGEWTSLGWRLFHRPWNWFRSRWGV